MAIEEQATTRVGTIARDAYGSRRRDIERIAAAEGLGRARGERLGW